MHARTRDDADSRSSTVVKVAAVLAVLAVIPLWVLLGHPAGGTEPPKQTAVPQSVAVNGVPAAAGTVATATGPLSDLDRTFMNKVRQAGLWEMPAGRLAQTHSSSEAVKRAGLHLLDGHAELDQMVREDAAALNFPLPNDPSAEQQGWLRQLDGAQGAEFDRLFANLLRNSHGKVFVVIGKVRAATQNTLMRQLAARSGEVVSDHMNVLEETGAVDSSTLDDIASSFPKS